MTLIQAPEELPPASVFLDTVCPGVEFLDDNIHFELKLALPGEALKEIDSVSWPLLLSSVAATATIDSTYLNVGRPAFEHDVNKNCESTTYVSLPFHITNLFNQVVSVASPQKQDGSLHVGANVNPLMHDPFRLVYLSPGCMSSMITLNNSSRHHLPTYEARNPFNKMTSSINRFLRMGGTSESSDNLKTYFVPLVESPDTLPFKQGKAASKPFSVLELDQTSYHSRLRSRDTSKLLVSLNVSVLNVFAIDENHNYAGISTVSSTKPVFPRNATQGESQELEKEVEPFKKVIEKPLLRLKLQPGLIATCIFTLSPEPIVLVGLNNGDIAMINLANLCIRYFDDLGRLQNFANLDAVTSLTVISHPQYEMLIVAGYSSGEVIIIDPAAPASVQPYKKSAAGKDTFITYFKKFDLSTFNKKESEESYIIGHFKLSHKPITSIASTIAHQGTIHFPYNPMIVAFASEDGLVRFVDLISTYDKNYGDPSQFYNQLIITDVVSSYFQDGVRSIEFSPDYRFFCLCGKGDLIEIYKMSYYKVDKLLVKNSSSQPRGGRSRSGTVNSSNLTSLHPVSSFFSPSNITPSTSLDLPRDEHTGVHYPPIVKDIMIVSRLKGHTNTVDRVKFIKNDASGGSYNLISCGSDGKVIVWEFDSKALPRVNKSHINTSHRPSLSGEANPQLNGKSKPNIISGKHNRTRSQIHQEDIPLSNSFSQLGISTLLSPSPQPLNSGDVHDEEQLKIVFSLYRSLSEVRLRKYYAGQQHNKEFRKRYSSIIHGIVNDKELPSIQIPLLTLDFSCLVKDGRIYGFHFADTHFWVFGRNGDILRYKIRQ